MDETSATVARMFAALGHENRVTIIRLLLAAHPGGLVVGELQNELAIPASTLSHHLDARKTASSRSAKAAFSAIAPAPHSSKSY